MALVSQNSQTHETVTDPLPGAGKTRPAIQTFDAAEFYARNWNGRLETLPAAAIVNRQSKMGKGVIHG